MAPPLVLKRLALILLLSAGSAAAEAATPAPVAADHAMVVSAQSLATETGLQILRAGGNVVDAAVAVGYALAVVYPAAGNLGGGGFMTIRFADGRTTFLDFREKAPIGATAAMFLDANGEIVPNRSTDSWLAVGVPGSVAGLDAALQRYGSLSRAVVMGPAIALARDGFVLDDGDTGLLRLGREGLARDPAAATIFQTGQPFAPRDRRPFTRVRSARRSSRRARRAAASCRPRISPTTRSANIQPSAVPIAASGSRPLRHRAGAASGFARC